MKFFPLVSSNNSRHSNWLLDVSHTAFWISEVFFCLQPACTDVKSDKLKKIFTDDKREALNSNWFISIAYRSLAENRTCDSFARPVSKSFNIQSFLPFLQCPGTSYISPIMKNYNCWRSEELEAKSNLSTPTLRSTQAVIWTIPHPPRVSLYGHEKQCPNNFIV